MGIVRWDSAVSEQDLKRKMIKPVQEIRGASVEQEAWTPARTCGRHSAKPSWRGCDRAMQGKTKRLILEINESENMPCLWNWGQESVWMRSHHDCQWRRGPPPREAPVKQGRSPGSWIDIGQIGRLLGTSGEHLAERWEALISE